MCRTSTGLTLGIGERSEVDELVYECQFKAGRTANEVEASLAPVGCRHPQERGGWLNDGDDAISADGRYQLQCSLAHHGFQVLNCFDAANNEKKALPYGIA